MDDKSKLPPWLYLEDDYDHELLAAQMHLEAFGWPSISLTGDKFGDADRAMRERERKVLTHSLGRAADHGWF